MCEFQTILCIQYISVCIYMPMYKNNTYSHTYLCNILYYFSIKID